MLYIYNPLVDRIKRHLKKNHINADIDFCIGRNWHKYRYIQVFPKGLDSCVHYEYINHHWELHFENADSNPKVEDLRQVMIRSIATSNNMSWHNWSRRQRGLLRLEEEVCDRTFETLSINYGKLLFPYSKMASLQIMLQRKNLLFCRKLLPLSMSIMSQMSLA